MDLTATIQKISALRADLSAHEAEAKARADAIRAEIVALSRALALDGAMLDEGKIALARTVVYVRGRWADHPDDLWRDGSRVPARRAGSGPCRTSQNYPVVERQMTPTTIALAGQSLGFRAKGEMR